MYTHIHICIYIYIYIYCLFSRRPVLVMFGLYHQFDHLRFKQSQHINVCSAARAVIQFVSSEIMKSRLLK